jgi:NAD(P)-dependent dehydrogenase (short-subunit alcohol dehydrogenase family)
MRKHIAIITGSSTGIGFETSLLLARNGFYTYATMRNLHKSNNIKKIAKEESLPLEVLPLDVDSDESVRKTIRKIIDKEKKIDVLVNNAGYGLFGALEELTIEQIKEQFDTNLLGAIRTIKEVLSTMRNQRNGIIINVSSIAGIVGVPAESIYASTKFALEGLTESLSYELEPFNIRLILIEPGVINSNFVPNIRYANSSNNSQQIYNKDEKRKIESRNDSVRSSPDKDSRSSYSKTVDSFLSNYFDAMKNAPSPKAVSKVILEAIGNASKYTRFLSRYTVGEDAKALSRIKKNSSDQGLHEFISKRLLRT